MVFGQMLTVFFGKVSGFRGQEASEDLRIVEVLRGKPFRTKRLVVRIEPLFNGPDSNPATVGPIVTHQAHTITGWIASGRKGLHGRERKLGLVPYLNHI